MLPSLYRYNVGDVFRLHYVRCEITGRANNMYYSQRSWGFYNYELVYLVESNTTIIDKISEGDLYNTWIKEE